MFAFQRARREQKLRAEAEARKKAQQDAKEAPKPSITPTVNNGSHRRPKE